LAIIFRFFWEYNFPTALDGIKIISYSHLDTFVLAEETSLSLLTRDRHGEDENAEARFKGSFSL